MAIPFAPKVNHTEAVGRDDRVFERGFFDNLSNGINNIPFDDLLAASQAGNQVVGATTVYIRTTGNDSTGDGTAANPVATSAGAIALLATKYPNSLFLGVTLNYGAGTYSWPSIGSAMFAGSAITITGAGDSTVFSSAASTGINVTFLSQMIITNVKFLRTTGGALIQFYGSNIQLTNITAECEGTSSNGILFRDRCNALITGTFKYILRNATTPTGAAIFCMNGGTVTINTTNFVIDVNMGLTCLNALTGGKISLIYELTAPVVSFPTSTAVGIAATGGGQITGRTAAAVAAFIGSTGTANVDAYSTIYGVSNA